MNAILDLHEASCDCRHWQCVALTLRRIRKKRWTNIYIFVYDCFLWKRYSPWTSKTDLLPFLLKVVSGSIFIVSLLDELTRIRQCERKLLETIWLSFSFFSSSKLFCVKNASPSCCTILSLDVILWNQENRKRIRQRMFKILLPV